VLPPENAQGLFARPGEHPAVLPVSAIPGDVLDDAIGPQKATPAVHASRVGTPRTGPAWASR
jgi:hypothetical protein